LKVTYIYQYFGTPAGSWSTRVYETCRRWVNQGIDVTVITSPYDKSDIKVNAFITKLEIEGIKLIVINSGDSNRFGKLKRVRRAILFAIVSSFYTIKLNSKYIIASSGPITIGIPALIGKFFTKGKMIFEVRDLWPAGGIEMGLIKGKGIQKLALWFENVCYINSKFIVTASIGQKQNILSRYPNLDIEVIPNASDNELFGNFKPLDESQLNAIGHKKYFLHIGSLGFIHNVGFLIEAAYHIQYTLKQSDMVFVFIGDGVEKNELIQKTKDLNLNNVIFLGQMPKESLIPWVSNCIATLFSTLNNPVQDTCSPNKIFDSFAASKPIVQTSQGWIKELISEHDCGYTTDPNEPLEFAKACVELSNNSELTEQMGKNAKDLAMNEFNRDLLANKLLNRLMN
jgi:glycosyltransferase involved in cell wall biosynthesis